VAARVCDFALGTDTGGSIRVPAAYCGIVGLKPTFGLVPVEGVFPLSPTLDHVGPLTRTSAQAAELLAVLSGEPCELASVTGLRVGILRRHVDDPAVEDGVRRCVEDAFETLRSAGIELVDVDVPELELADQTVGTIVVKEAYDVHRDLRWSAEAPVTVRDASGHRGGQERRRGARRKALRGPTADRRRLCAPDAVDLLAGPTVAHPAPTRTSGRDAGGGRRGTLHGPYNLAGLPAVSVP
jgi:aspartyl-tRNA(Asn)/glutamyl-tRNA(Gln) amidotransferase subunit A